MFELPTWSSCVLHKSSMIHGSLHHYAWKWTYQINAQSPNCWMRKCNEINVHMFQDAASWLSVMIHFWCPNTDTLTTCVWLQHWFGVTWWWGLTKRQSTWPEWQQNTSSSLHNCTMYVILFAFRLTQPWQVIFTIGENFLSLCFNFVMQLEGIALSQKPTTIPKVGL